MLLLDELDTPSGCGDLYTARQQSTGATAGGGKGGCQATVEAAAASLCRLQTAAAGITVIQLQCVMVGLQQAQFMQQQSHTSSAPAMQAPWLVY